MNPLKAKLVATAADWHWFSAQAHLTDQSDGLLDQLRAGQSIGRSLMSEERLKELERIA